MRREICKGTGLIPSRFSPARLNELFLAGTEPREDSADYFASDGKLLLPDAYGRWCASRDNTIGAHARSDFRITSPPPNAHYEIDPVLPSSQQMVELTTAMASEVEWFVNNERIFAQHDSRFFWQLAPGEWKLRGQPRATRRGENYCRQHRRSGYQSGELNGAIQFQMFSGFLHDSAQRTSCFHRVFRRLDIGSVET